MGLGYEEETNFHDFHFCLVDYHNSSFDMR